MITRRKLFFIGDIHHQQHDRDALLCSQALSLWRLIAAACAPAPMFLLGDMIDGYQLPIDICRRDLTSFAHTLKDFPGRVFPLVGNHEVINLPDRPFMLETLGIQSFSRVVEAGPLRMVLFDLTVDGESFGELTPDRAAWLSDALQTRPLKPAIIVQHPLLHPSDDLCTHRHYVRNSGEYRRFLSRFPQVLLLMTGHRHLPTLTQFAGNRGDTGTLLPQVTLGAFSAFPFSVGELSLFPEKGQAVLREIPLESLLTPQAASAFTTTLALGEKLMREQNPEIWSNRPRLTPELREVVLSWND